MANNKYVNQTKKKDTLYDIRDARIPELSEDDSGKALVVGEDGNADIRDVSNLSKVTYEQLKTLRDNSQLIPGKFYRIIDYQCTTSKENTSSAGHTFDIIVTALSENILSERAEAILHEEDEYFANNKLEAWELKYCLDNDTNRFNWADSENGKGVIYFMRDEFENEAFYDFKNILFTYENHYIDAYTFSYKEDSAYKDASLLKAQKCYDNIIRDYMVNDVFYLNFNVFFTNDAILNCYENYLDEECHYNTFNANCYGNTLEKGCYENNFSTTSGVICNDNHLGPRCHNNFLFASQSDILGEGCASNNFYGSNWGNKLGDHVSNNTFSAYFQDNVLGDYCNHNSFGQNCYNNILEGGCTYISINEYSSGNYIGYSSTYINLGRYASRNSIGRGCSYVKFGTSGTSFSYSKFITVEDGCSYLYIDTTDTTAGAYLQNITIHKGIKGTSDSSRTTITVASRNNQYSIDYYASGSENKYI